MAAARTWLYNHSKRRMVFVFFVQELQGAKDPMPGLQTILARGSDSEWGCTIRNETRAASEAVFFFFFFIFLFFFVFFFCFCFFFVLFVFFFVSFFFLFFGFVGAKGTGG